jgi:hypothetical protein
METTKLPASSAKADRGECPAAQIGNGLLVCRVWFLAVRLRLQAFWAKEVRALHNESDNVPCVRFTF